MNSLRGRLLAWLLAGVACVGALAGWVAYRNALVEASAFFDYELEQTALLLRDQPFGLLLGEPPAMAENPSYDFVVQVFSLDGVRVYLSRPHTVLPGLTQLGLSTVKTSEGRWRVYGVLAPNRVIQVAQPMEVREARAAGLAFRSLQPFALLLPVLALLIWIVVGHTLAPLRHLTQAVKSRAAGSLDPLPLTQLPDEVQPLVAALNDLLARLSAALERERAFLADAAHELRTPLTALRLQMESLVQSRDEGERGEAIGRLSAGVQRAIRLAEQLLALARSEPQTATAQAFEVVRLDDLAREVVAELMPLADAKRIDLGVASATEAQVRGNVEALRTLLRNLVDNAVRYTPEGGRVDVSVLRTDERGEPRASLRVEDTGPGIPVDQRERAFDRFYRAPGTTAPGSGLGLAIVKSIAAMHGASVTLGDADGAHGLVVTVDFPASA